MPRSIDCYANRRRMMREIVHNEYTRRFSFYLQPPQNAKEGCHRAFDCIASNASAMRDRDCCQGIENVVPPGDRHFDGGHIGTAIGNSKPSLASGKLNIASAVSY